MQELKKVLNQSNETVLKLSDEGIERAVLACLMIEPTKMVEASVKLSIDDFVNNNNKYLYEIMLAIYKKHGAGKYSFDLASLISIAESKGARDKFLERSGGEEYIEFLNIVKNSMVDINKFNFYVDRISQLSTKRKLVLNAEAFKEEVLSSDLSPDELAAKERNNLDVILLETESTEYKLSNLATNAEALVKDAFLEKKTLLGIPTGFPKLDKKIQGLRKGALTIISAPRKTGKSAFLMNIGINVGIRRRIPTLMISTEMSDEEIMWRVISNLSQVPQNNIIRGDVSDKDKVAIQNAINTFKLGQFYHVTLRGFTLEKIIGITRKFIANNVGYLPSGEARDCLILFDYIKLPQAELKTSKDLKEHKILGALADGLKILAGEQGLPIVTACQTNRVGDVANSYELTWFCDTFMELSKKSQKELDSELMGNAGYTGNQRLKITANRGAEEDHKGIPLDYDGNRLTYMEVNLND